MRLESNVCLVAFGGSLTARRDNLLLRRAFFMVMLSDICSKKTTEFMIFGKKLHIFVRNANFNV